MPQHPERIPGEEGTYEAVFRVPPNILMARRYLISIGLWSTPSGGRSIVYDHQASALGLTVEAAPVGPYAHQHTRDGFVHVEGCEWTVAQVAMSKDVARCP